MPQNRWNEVWVSLTAGISAPSCNRIFVEKQNDIENQQKNTDEDEVEENEVEEAEEKKKEVNEESNEENERHRVRNEQAERKVVILDEVKDFADQLVASAMRENIDEDSKGHKTQLEDESG